MISINLDLLVDPACPAAVRQVILDRLREWRSADLIQQDVFVLARSVWSEQQEQHLKHELETAGWQPSQIQIQRYASIQAEAQYTHAEHQLRGWLVRWHHVKAHIEIAREPKPRMANGIPQALLLVDGEQSAANWLSKGQVSRKTLLECLSGYQAIALGQHDDELANIIRDQSVRFCSSLQLVERLLSADGQALSRPKPSLAWVSPMPPDRTGIAEYSESLLPGLSQYFDVTVITDSQYRSQCSAVKAVRSVAWLKQNGGRFDRICYHIGNSPFHQAICNCLRQWPGVVVMHEVLIGNLMYSFDARKPGANERWLQCLYQTHGYAGLMAAVREEGAPIQALKHYACNGEVLERSLGAIVHSAHAATMIADEVRPEAQLPVAIVPMCHRPRHLPDRHQARQDLGLSDDALLICSFGMTGAAKMSLEIAQAWSAITLAPTSDATLLFVGSNDCGDYGEQITALIDREDSVNPIAITGWIDDQTYENYLAACDLAIQIRAHSRGETSAAIYDVLCSGIPVIVNQQMALSDEATTHCTVISEKPSVDEIQSALQTLILKRQRERERLAVLAPRLQQQHHPDHVASAYALKLDHIYSEKRAIERRAIVDLARSLDRQPNSLVAASQTIVANFTRSRPKRQLFVDVSQIVRSDYKTGIQRVVRSLVLELIDLPLQDFRVEPVWLSTAGQSWHYCYARRWTSALIDAPISPFDDEPIEFSNGDLLLLADLTGSYLIEANRAGLYQQLRQAGVDIAAIVYDILPIQFPQYFPPGSEQTHIDWLRSVSSICSKLLCISNAVAVETKAWLQEDASLGKRAVPEMGWFHLGADIINSSPTLGLPNDFDRLQHFLRDRLSFLMVGTIEPRKGYRQAFKAFEQLLNQGHAYNLIIIGKMGWMMSDFESELKSSPHFNRGIFWFDRASDEFLELLYQRCQCLIAASMGEGFGLPLIEAARHTMPMLVRDLPVFREVAQTGAAYFSGTEPEDLASAVHAWAASYEVNAHPHPSDLTWLTWRDSALQVVNQLGLECKP